VATSRLTSIKLLSHNGSAPTTETVAAFSYNTDALNGGRLAEAWDPRISPLLKTTYAYDSSSKRVMTVTPSGEAPWSMVYNQAGGGETNPDKLQSVKRTSSSSGTGGKTFLWKQTISGAGTPAMSATELDRWAQTDRPTDMTTVKQLSSTGDLISHYYLDQDGRIVNKANPGGGISTTEYDPTGNVVRELSPANRAKALAVGAGSATLAGLIDTRSEYSTDGLRLEDEYGPQHSVRLDSGQVVTARAHTHTSYDEGLPAGAKPAHLPTTVTTGAYFDPSSSDSDTRTVKTEYDWNLRQPTKTIVDPGGLNIVRETRYNAAGLATESRQPKSNGADAGTTKTIYYGDSSDSACSGRAQWFNMPCKTKPAAQPGTAGLPDLPVTTYTYNQRLQVLTETETVGETARKTTTTYDAAGRRKTESTSAVGLVASYGFDAGSGTTVADDSGTGNNGTISGATWTPNGKNGGALDFDGTNDSVSIPGTTSTLAMTTGMTLSAWVKPRDIAGLNQQIIGRDSLSLGGSAWSLNADSASQKPGFTVFAQNPSTGTTTSGTASGTAALTNGDWAHLTGVWTGSIMSLYVNGTLVGFGSVSGNVVNTGEAIKIGGTSVGGVAKYFDGLIDDVRIYNRALSSAEILDDYNTSVGSQGPAGIGKPVATRDYWYSSTTGRPTTVAGLVTTYDDLGRVTAYKDADGTTSTTSYDNLNRPTSTDDGKGTQTFSYSTTTGLLTSLTDSQAGTFGATYDDDGRIVSKTYPNEMKADTTYDDAGSPTRLKYIKTSNCSTNCQWIFESLDENIHGQWRTHNWELSSQGYYYDAAGRLKQVNDTINAPVASGCTVRKYTFDANSNRTSMLTRAPAAGGACAPTGGTSTSYTFDDADRLTGTGIKYDTFGRTTSIPAQYAGGGALTYTYYANGQVETIAQDGVSKTYTLDGAGRQRKTVGSDGQNATETLHYSDSSDSPSWTRVADAQGAEIAWERTITGIDGDLAAIRTHDAQGDTTTLQLTNLHGDIIATASTDPTAGALLDKFETDEFGNPRNTAGATRSYGWLGGKQRRAVLDSGVIQMGVRSYVPTLGRFTSVDPVAGGSASTYDYANADPVNQLDLDGRKAKPGYACQLHIGGKVSVLEETANTTTYKLRGRARMKCSYKVRGLEVKVRIGSAFLHETYQSGDPGFQRKECSGTRNCRVKRVRSFTAGRPDCGNGTYNGSMGVHAYGSYINNRGRRIDFDMHRAYDWTADAICPQS